jgi:hypothetical protein
VRGVENLPPFRAVVKEGVDLYLHSSCVPSWHVIGGLYHPIKFNLLIYRLSSAGLVAKQMQECKNTQINT